MIWLDKDELARSVRLDRMEAMIAGWDEPSAARSYFAVQPVEATPMPYLLSRRDKMARERRKKPAKVLARRKANRAARKARRNSP